MTRLTGVRVAFLVAPEGVEQVELTRPWQAVRREGGSPRLVSTTQGTVQAFRHLDRADRFPVDATVGQVTARDFDALVLPGGVVNGDHLRTDPAAVDLVRGFVTGGGPIAAVCHAAWTLIEADGVRGRRMTSWPSLRTDLVNAGARWVDAEVVVDRGLVTSRKPADLEAFCSAMVEAFAAGPGPARPDTAGRRRAPA